MNSYWKNHYDSICKQFDGSLLTQVGKTVNGREIPELQVKLIVENIVNVLRLSTKDYVVDLCCGNGLITRQFAPLVKDVVGMDFTSGLIDAAKRYSSFHNIEYVNSDVLRPDPKYFSGLKKIVMYEALQHFSEQQFGILLDELESLAAGSLVFFGSIPNKEKLSAYYDTEEKFTFYLRSEREGKPHMGRWWEMEEIERIVSGRSFKTTFLPQVTSLYTAYYRFGVLLEKYQ
ncbi:Methyltransferase domain-containing protein [Candidatus Nitrotoga sp. BS]|uniref:class I SAM-dependent methyltransferase n=1 Tax=Candidatus Nitrotoga sp. BS TaxID=2890408 RepID=UPI001EF39F08|nr:class I SAM-dependent methyltransferase [Candidatus Nitrotoga sp. BS]CAH1192980.1 Methyltransferase domain-containing protein [Candidatus Nitrotoga sp. BS]